MTSRPSEQGACRRPAAVAIGWEAAVEVDYDAVLLELSASRPADSARAEPGQRTCQVFMVKSGAVVEIRTYPNRAAALARL